MFSSASLCNRSFLNDKRREQIKQKNEAIKKANEVIEYSKLVVEILGQTPNLDSSLQSEFLKKQVFLSELTEYLKSRVKETFNGDVELEKRVKFINDIVLLIALGNNDELKSKLSEENIKPFKGFVSKRLYTILRDYRNNNGLMLDNEKKMGASSSSGFFARLCKSFSCLQFSNVSSPTLRK